jgi:hypothetical protein
MKRCSKCLKTKPLSEFRKHRRSCIECEYAQARQWRKDNSDKVKQYAQRYNIKKLYGAEYEDIVELYKLQNGKCMICEIEKPLHGANPADTLHIDHDHITGQIRGLLCTSCNNGLGRFKDTPELLRKAADYLERRTENVG